MAEIHFVTCETHHMTRNIHEQYSCPMCVLEREKNERIAALESELTQLREAVRVIVDDMILESSSFGDSTRKPRRSMYATIDQWADKLAALVPKQEAPCSDD